MKKYALIFFVIGLVVSLLFYISKSYSPGSYGEAETYELNIAEPDLISTIEKFKDDNPQLQVPSQVGLLDHKNNHWYVIYFYYKQENQIIYTWTRPAGKDKTTLAFVSVNDGLTLSKWKNINKDFSSSENRLLIENFEERILKDLKERINHW